MSMTKKEQIKFFEREIEPYVIKRLHKQLDELEKWINKQLKKCENDRLNYPACYEGIMDCAKDKINSMRKKQC